jgi:hypothetical protein
LINANNGTGCGTPTGDRSSIVGKSISGESAA